MTERLIPARAGKTWSPRAPGAGVKAHPRAGGENRRGGYQTRDDAGSSPRGRGKHWKFKVTNDGKGLIPARAGKTGGLDTSHVKEAAHPRAGGENESGNAIDYQAIGSSPRGRGKLADLARSPGERRLIPARAGKTTVR